jgi:hypothetical protein
MSIRDIIKNVLRKSTEDFVVEQDSFSKFMDFMIGDYKIWKGIGWDGNTLYFAKKGVDFPTDYFNYDFYINIDKGYLLLTKTTKDIFKRYFPFGDDVLFVALRNWFKSSLGITLGDIKVGWERLYLISYYGKSL